ncbi:MAG: amylo-alpha-1,6-glucosidase [Nanoarchaeota archaeon]
MEVIHDAGSFSVRRIVNENAGFLLTGKNGSYCSFFNEPFSRYQGLFLYDSQTMGMYKFIENIELTGLNDTDSIQNCFYCAKRKKGGKLENFFMPKGFNSLVYELNSESEIDVILDCKNIYDNSESGRHYEMLEDKRCIIIKFTKKRDEKENLSSEEIEFVLYLAIQSDKSYHKKNDEWIARNYPFDETRNSPPFKRHVYNALRLKGSKFVFSMSKNKESAINESKFIFNNLERLKSKEKGNFFELLKNKSIKHVVQNKELSDQIKMAYINALNSLSSLFIDCKKTHGLIAGLPWFFQFWSRDSLVSIKAFSKIDKLSAAKILIDYLNSIQGDGRLQNLTGQHSSKSIGAADAHGWLFFRCRELLAEIDKNKTAIDSILTANDIESSLEKSIYCLLKSNTNKNFESNEVYETWMDTVFKTDKRSGFRVEIQALRLNMYKLMFELTQDSKYKVLENVLKNKVRNGFWNGAILADGLNDFTLRPNIFIASYIYPELLTQQEWQACFDNSLKNLWLEWGGLSTIDINNPLFTGESTGEDVKSYHRGDSWFWINNLAALTLNRINKNKFRKYITKIIGASTEEILWKGCIGCHSELSSAKELQSRGCFNQAWSNAMYLEMIDEVFSILNSSN